MGEDFEDSVDTSLFDDINTDTTDTSSFSDPVDVGGMMDDIPAEPIESFDVEPIYNSFETELPTAEIQDIDSLVDDAADTYTTGDVPSDVLDSSGLDPSDISSNIDDYEMDAGFDIVDLMDEAAIESLEDTTMDIDDMSQTTDNNIESLMNEVDITPDIGAVTFDAKPEIANEGNASEIESLLNTEGVNPSDLSDTSENISDDISGTSSETSDISALMDENNVVDSTNSISENQEGLSDAFEVQEELLIDLNDAADISSDEIAENSDEFTEMMEDRIRENFAAPNADNTEYGEKELSAMDRMGEYYSSHNYGQMDFQEYSKDPEWQELNNDLLREMGREPIDYSNEDTPNIENIREMFVAAGISEGSPELEVITANEQGGIDAIVEAQQSASPPVNPIDGGASSPPIEPPIDPIESIDDVDSSSEPVHLTQSDVEEFIENSSDTDAPPNLRDGIESGDIQIYVDDAAEGSGSGPVLTRDVSEQWESGNRAINDNIEAMRDDLRDKGLEDGPEIESIVMAERARMQEELERNIRGDFSDPYQKPDFGELLQERQVSEGLVANGQDIPQELPEETPSVTDLPNEINYDEVFEGLDDYDFDGIDYASDTDRLDSSLDNFDSNTWEGLTLDEQKAAMTDLADYVKDVIGFDNPPEIVYYNNPVDGDYGGYSPESNALEVNEYMLYNNEEAADTVAHELWHAYQHQRASNPQSAKDYQYQYGFDNYIRPEDDFAGYQNQLVEAEARAFAQQFKDRLNMKGRRI